MTGTLTRLIPTPVAPDQPSNCVFPVKREHNYSQKLRKQVPEALSSPPLHHFFMFCHVLLPFPLISFQFLRSPRTFLREYHSYAIDDLFTRARLQWRLSLNYLEICSSVDSMEQNPRISFYPRERRTAYEICSRKYWIAKKFTWKRIPCCFFLDVKAKEQKSITFGTKESIFCVRKC